MRTSFALKLLLLVSLTNSVNAGTIREGDWKTSGDSLLTIDSIQDLEFLDVTASTNLSYDFVTTQFGSGGLYEGFRYASRAEVGNLMSNIASDMSLSFSWNGIDRIGNPAGSSGSSFGGLTGRFIDLLGMTWSREGQLFLGALTSDPNSLNPNLLETIVVNDFGPGGPFPIDFIDGSAAKLQKNFSREDWGNFLVRSATVVPEPASATILGTGILCLLPIRRKRMKR